MEKPIILIEDEMRGEFADLVNKYLSQLPTTIVVTVLKDAYEQVTNLASKQLVEAREHYYKESEGEIDVR